MYNSINKKNEGKPWPISNLDKIEELFIPPLS
jgi:hypothetical protein